MVDEGGMDVLSRDMRLHICRIEKSCPNSVVGLLLCTSFVGTHYLFIYELSVAAFFYGVVC